MKTESEKKPHLPIVPDAPPRFQMWHHAVVDLTIRERLCGGIPKNKDMIEAWIAARMKALAAEKRAELAEKTASELAAATEEAAEKAWCGFKGGTEDHPAIYIEGRQVKAMIKESVNVLRDWLQAHEKAGKKPAVAPTVATGDKPEKKAPKDKSRYTAIKAKIAERAYVEEDRILFMRDGKALLAPDGSEEKAIHVDTAQGPRDALKRTDYVEAPASITFHMKWLADGVFDVELLGLILEHASENGLGADRSQGNGRFRVEKIEQID